MNFLRNKEYILRGEVFRNTLIKAEKGKLSERIGRKVMGLRHLYRLLLPFLP